MVELMKPDSPLFVAGGESVAVASSLAQARPIFRMARFNLEGSGDFAFRDGASMVGILHKPTRTRLDLRACNQKTIGGLMHCPLILLDEAGSYEHAAGQEVYHLARTAMGKAGAKTRLVCCSTLAPQQTMPGMWFYDLAHSRSNAHRHVQLVKGRTSKIEVSEAIRCCPNLDRRTLRNEVREAASNSSARAAFRSYRLNQPSGDEKACLLTPEEWASVCERPFGERGKPVLGIDVGGARSWTSCAAIHQSGLIECFAHCGSRPSIPEREKADRVPKRTYMNLVKAGVLHPQPAVSVPVLKEFIKDCRRRWPDAIGIYCDRFRLSELKDALYAAGWQLPVEAVVSRWSQSTHDINALRRMAADGPLSCEPAAAQLLTQALSCLPVSTDDSGNMRLVKQDSRRSRDDSGVALVLAAGGQHKRLTRAARPQTQFIFEAA